MTTPACRPYRDATRYFLKPCLAPYTGGVWQHPADGVPDVLVTAKGMRQLPGDAAASWKSPALAMAMAKVPCGRCSHSAGVTDLLLERTEDGHCSDGLRIAMLFPTRSH